MPRNNVSDVPPATPGYQTTEFWKNLLVTLSSLLVGLGVITPDVSNKFSPWVAGIALAAAAISTGMYALSRGKTKAAAIEAAAQVVIAQKHIDHNRELANLPQSDSTPQV